jgi:hypothetical protein
MRLTNAIYDEAQVLQHHEGFSTWMNIYIPRISEVIFIRFVPTPTAMDPWSQGRWN